MRCATMSCGKSGNIPFYRYLRIIAPAMCPLMSPETGYGTCPDGLYFLVPLYLQYSEVGTYRTSYIKFVSRKEYDFSRCWHEITNRAGLTREDIQQCFWRGMWWLNIAFTYKPIKIKNCTSFWCSITYHILQLTIPL